MRPASELERRRLNETFAALCSIPSPSGEEGAVAALVERELRTLGLEVEEDGAAALVGGERGNLLVRIPGRSDRAVLLGAHLDTVGGAEPIEPVLVDGGWESAAGAILGADNKAAVALLLEVARRTAVEGSPVALELLFTVCQERALEGAKAIEPGWLRADAGLVFDHASPIGEIVVGSPSCVRWQAELVGRAAHAGIRPEDGRSAIVAAAKAIASLPSGRIDSQTTLNVAQVRGGRDGTGTVPDRCTIVGEARSLADDALDGAIGEIVLGLHEAANDPTCSCDLDLVFDRPYEGYRLRSSDPLVQIAEAALAECGYAPRRVVSGGGSDANALIAAGLPCINLANGTERSHEPGERVSQAALEGMLDVAYTLLDILGES